MGEQCGPGDVEDDWKRWSDAECNKTSGGQGSNGATISTRHHSNQVGMTLLADRHIHDFTLFNSLHLRTSKPGSFH